MDFKAARITMVETQIIRRGVRNQQVIDAMKKVQRHLFVDQALRHRAYDDHPLPLSDGQTISQPYIVALMTELLEPTKAAKILELGTGSGYQSAVLAEICAFVYSIERIPALAKRARDILDGMGYHNVMIQVGDGTYGWKTMAPFDGILVTAAAPDVPLPLLDQLTDGGRLVVPVGDEFSQDLIVIRKSGSRYVKTNHGGVRFVKLIGNHGWKEVAS